MAATQPVLRLGAHGGAVVTLQRRLAALHYFDVGAADGVFGAGTYHAVVAFQKVQGLTRDGVAGQVTWARLAVSISRVDSMTCWRPLRRS